MRGKISKKKNQITFQFIEVKLRDNEKWLIGHHSINSNFEKVKVTSTLMPYILYLYLDVLQQGGRVFMMGSNDRYVMLQGFENSNMDNI